MTFFLTYWAGLGYFNLAQYGALNIHIFKTGEIWRLLTYGFLHSSVRHFIQNLALGVLISLYLEQHVSGKLIYLTFLLGVIIGGLGFVLFTIYPTHNTVGASAGIWALLALTLLINIRNNSVFLIVLGLTVILILSTLTANNVNNISHYSSYISIITIYFITKQIRKKMVCNEN